MRPAYEYETRQYVLPSIIFHTVGLFLAFFFAFIYRPIAPPELRFDEVEIIDGASFDALVANADAEAEGVDPGEGGGEASAELGTTSEESIVEPAPPEDAPAPPLVAPAPLEIQNESSDAPTDAPVDDIDRTDAPSLEDGAETPEDVAGEEPVEPDTNSEEVVAVEPENDSAPLLEAESLPEVNAPEQPELTNSLESIGAFETGDSATAFDPIEVDDAPEDTENLSEDSPLEDEDQALADLPEPPAEEETFEGVVVDTPTSRPALLPDAPLPLEPEIAEPIVEPEIFEPTQIVEPFPDPLVDPVLEPVESIQDVLSTEQDVIDDLLNDVIGGTPNAAGAVPQPNAAQGQNLNANALPQTVTPPPPTDAAQNLNEDDVIDTLFNQITGGGFASGQGTGQGGGRNITPQERSIVEQAIMANWDYRPLFERGDVRNMAINVRFQTDIQGFVVGDIYLVVNEAATAEQKFAYQFARDAILNTLPLPIPPDSDPNGLIWNFTFDPVGIPIPQPRQ